MPAEILIYEEIGGWFGGVTASGIAAQLADLKGESEIRLRINSPGGDVFEGTAIYNLLVSHPATITVDIDGAAMSAASFIAMAGDTVRMAENALLMIHNPWTIAMGEASDFDATANLLRTIKENILTTYQARAKDSDREELSRLMDETTYLTAEQSKALGFVDEITGRGQAAEPTQNRFKALLAKQHAADQHAVAALAEKPQISLAMRRAELLLTKLRVSA